MRMKFDFKDLMAPRMFIFASLTFIMKFCKQRFKYRKWAEKNHPCILGGSRVVILSFSLSVASYGRLLLLHSKYTISHNRTQEQIIVYS